MPSPKATQIKILARELGLLEAISNQPHSTPQEVRRSKILLLANQGATNSNIAKSLVVNRKQVIEWRSRWAEAMQQHAEEWKNMTDDELTQSILNILSDKPRSGRPSNAQKESQMSHQSQAEAQANRNGDLNSTAGSRS